MAVGVSPCVGERQNSVEPVGWCIPPYACINSLCEPRAHPRANTRPCTRLCAGVSSINSPVVRFYERKGAIIRFELLISQYSRLYFTSGEEFPSDPEQKKTPGDLITLGDVAVPMLYLFILSKSAIRTMKNTMIHIIMNIVYTSLLLLSIITQ